MWAAVQYSHSTSWAVTAKKTRFNSSRMLPSLAVARLRLQRASVVSGR